MRVWLLEQDGCENAQASLAPLLRNLAQHPLLALTVVGVSGQRTDLPTLLRSGVLHVLVFNTVCWPAQQNQTDILDLGFPVLIVGSAGQMERWSSQATQRTLAFLPTSAGENEIAAALWSLHIAKEREENLRGQLQRMQQRLNDRIIIEKAKGVLVQRLRIDEEEAYKRLRVQSRRQRKQIREIAQSILDTQFLLESNGHLGMLNVPADAGMSRRDRSPFDVVPPGTTSPPRDVDDALSQEL